MSWESKWDKSGAVGYKKPPVHSRFKPGQSGNPLGRRRVRKSNTDLLKEELSRVCIITEDGQKKKVSQQQLLWKVLIAGALKGNMRATVELFKLMEQHGLGRNLDFTTRKMIIRFVKPDPTPET
jgi:hypothetical protein